MNFRPVTLKKELSDFFQKIHDPGYAKKLKKRGISTKFFLAGNNLKSFEIRPQHPLKFSMNFKLVTLKKELSDLSKKCMTPGMKKNSKNEKFIQNLFLVRNNFRPVTLKKELSDFSKTPWPRICKKTQKMRNLYKIFFGSKQPKKLWNTSAIPFLKFPMNFRPVTLKKELSDS